MNSKSIIAVRVVLAIVAVFFGYKIFQLINEPVEFDKLKEKRYDVVKNRLVQIREAQTAYKDEFGKYCADIHELVAFVDTGVVTILERKDTIIRYYDKVYQTEMDKDSVIIREIGQSSVKEFVFKDPNFDAERLRNIPFSKGRPFKMDAAVLERRGTRLPVFEVSAHNEAIFEDLMTSKYREYIDMEYSLVLGSLTEPKISGNW
ncbi:MAG: hypothetical protein LAT76_12335 [Schleiferiaceae bacterium]|nr:hypothetical protein [Schleiferiaceae bacterium]